MSCYGPVVIEMTFFFWQEGNVMGIGPNIASNVYWSSYYF